jgi:hypothetical protein
MPIIKCFIIKNIRTIKPKPCTCTFSRIAFQNLEEFGLWWTNRTGRTEQGRQKRTGRIGQAEQDRQNRTAGTGLPEQDRQNRTRIKGHPKQDRQDTDLTERVASVRQTVQDSQKKTDRRRRDVRKRTARTGQTEQDCDVRKSGTGLPE